MFGYSAKYNAFYQLSSEDNYRQAGLWPDDVIPVEDGVASEFMGAIPPGKKLASDKDGAPTWVDIPPPTKAELISAANAKKEQMIHAANAYINGNQWVGKAVLGRLSDKEKSQYNAWLDYLDELEAVDTSTAPEITWPEQPQ